jgi:short-subunit dehydrogenase
VKTDNHRTAVVTGAAGGLGACFARKLAERGYDLMLVDCRAEPLAQLAAELATKHGVAARAWPADLTDAKAVKSVAAELAETPALELLVNNAGFGLAKHFVDADVERHLDMIRVHVLAAVRLTHAVLPGMLNRNRGAIVNMASLCAWTPCAGVVSYSSTKAYLVAFSEGLQDELRDTDIRIQALCPAFVRTGFHVADGMSGFDAQEIPRWLWMMPDDVVECSLRGLLRKRVIVTPGWRTGLLCRLMRMPILQPIVRALVRQERS